MSKALSPVIAAILMIIVVVALVIILYGFSVGLIGGTTTTATEAGTGMTGSTSTGVIDAVDSGNSEIFVRSTNDVGSVIDSIYVNGVRTTCTSITLAADGLIELNSTQCSGLSLVSNQTIVVTGSNNFRATSKS